MAYTEQQLKEGFLEMEGYNSETDGTEEEFIAKARVVIQENLDRRLARIPTVGEYLKEQVVEYLIEKEIEANEGGEF